MTALLGLRVLITASDGERLGELLRARGAELVLIPTIAIRAIDAASLDAALDQRWDWVVVTSPNGARAVVDRLAARGAQPPRAPRLEGPRWAAVGPRSAAALRAAGIEPAIAPMDGTGARLAEALGLVAGKRVLLARARRASADLPRIFRARGAEVTDVPVYETVEGPESARGPLAEALTRGIGAIVFTSGSTVRGFARLAGDPARILRGTAVVAIGPTTAAVARTAGLDPRVARARTPEAIVEALESERGARVDG
ncbi:MAG: uroporphyrinogen-III synthase [Gemmatimonadota bacterium]